VGGRDKGEDKVGERQREREEETLRGGREREKGGGGGGEGKGGRSEEGEKYMDGERDRERVQEVGYREGFKH
jgi:hypothetical protein